MRELTFNSQYLGFSLSDKTHYSKWLVALSEAHSKKLGDIEYFFCTDEWLLELNKSSLGHDYYTDVITFDSSIGEIISGEIYISVDRVKDHANEYKTTFEKELLRVMAHGLLHLCGYADKSTEDKTLMRAQEQVAIELFKDV